MITRMTRTEAEAQYDRLMGTATNHFHTLNFHRADRDTVINAIINTGLPANDDAGIDNFFNHSIGPNPLRLTNLQDALISETFLTNLAHTLGNTHPIIDLLTRDRILKDPLINAFVGKTQDERTELFTQLTTPQPDVAGLITYLNTAPWSLDATLFTPFAQIVFLENNFDSAIAIFPDNIKAEFVRNKALFNGFTTAAEFQNFINPLRDENATHAQILNLVGNDAALANLLYKNNQYNHFLNSFPAPSLLNTALTNDATKNTLSDYILNNFSPTEVNNFIVRLTDPATTLAVLKNDLNGAGIIDPEQTSIAQLIFAENQFTRIHTAHATLQPHLVDAANKPGIMGILAGLTDPAAVDTLINGLPNLDKTALATALNIPNANTLFADLQYQGFLNRLPTAVQSFLNPTYAASIKTSLGNLSSVAEVTAIASKLQNAEKNAIEGILRTDLGITTLPATFDPATLFGALQFQQLITTAPAHIQTLLATNPNVIANRLGGQPDKAGVKVLSDSLLMADKADLPTALNNLGIPALTTAEIDTLFSNNAYEFLSKQINDPTTNFAAKYPLLRNLITNNAASMLPVLATSGITFVDIQKVLGQLTDPTKDLAEVTTLMASIGLPTGLPTLPRGRALPPGTLPNANRIFAEVQLNRIINGNYAQANPTFLALLNANKASLIREIGKQGNPDAVKALMNTLQDQPDITSLLLALNAIGITLNTATPPGNLTTANIQDFYANLQLDRLERMMPSEIRKVLENTTARANVTNVILNAAVGTPLTFDELHQKFIKLLEPSASPKEIVQAFQAVGITHFTPQSTVVKNLVEINKAYSFDHMETKLKSGSVDDLIKWLKNSSERGETVKGDVVTRLREQLELHLAALNFRGAKPAKIAYVENLLAQLNTISQRLETNKTPAERIKYHGNATLMIGTPGTPATDQEVSDKIQELLGNIAPTPGAPGIGVVARHPQGELNVRHANFAAGQPPLLIKNEIVHATNITKNTTVVSEFRKNAAGEATANLHFKWPAVTATDPNPVDYLLKKVSILSKKYDDALPKDELLEIAFQFWRNWDKVNPPQKGMTFDLNKNDFRPPINDEEIADRLTHEAFKAVVLVGKYTGHAITGYQNTYRAELDILATKMKKQPRLDPNISSLANPADAPTRSTKEIMEDASSIIRGPRR